MNSVLGYQLLFFRMGYNIEWIIPKLRKPTVLWNIASSLTCAAVGIFSKILLEWLNTTQVYNKDIVVTNIDKRPKNVPLLTVSNHHSCFDDPGLWGVLDLRQILNRNKTRWALAAHDICFTNVIHSYFFMLGKCVPIIRGKGVYQKAMDFCLEKLSKGEWVHIFPEGRVNMAKEFIRFKWGVGRLVYEAPILPIIIPMWHIGMDNILPNEPPYVLKMRNKVTLNFGKPIDLSELVNSLKLKNVSALEARKKITDKIQDELMILKAETEKLHLLTLRS